MPTQWADRGVGFRDEIESKSRVEGFTLVKSCWREVFAEEMYMPYNQRERNSKHIKQTCGESIAGPLWLLLSSIVQYNSRFGSLLPPAVGKPESIQGASISMDGRVHGVWVWPFGAT
jgi:hypothetical protein